MAFKCKYLLSDCEAKLDLGMENRGIWLVRTDKDLNRSVKFDKFCNRKFDKRRILFSTGFVERLRYAFIIRGFGWLSSFWISP